MRRACVVLLVVVTGVLAIRQSAGDDGPPVGAQAAPDRSGTLWSRLQGEGRTASNVKARARLRRRFALWRGRPETMPRRLEHKVLATLGAPAGTRLADTQRVRTAHGGVWAVDAGAATCVIQASRGAVMCAPPSQVARRGLMLGVYATGAHGRPTRFLALGIAPNGTRHARLTVGGAKRRVPVLSNAYALEATAPILFEGLES